MALPVVIDTDIGTDIDDSWALAFALRCPELDICLVTTSTGDAVDRAALVAELLAAEGRADVPIGVGLPGRGDWTQPLRAAGRAALDDHPGGALDGVTAVIEVIDAAVAEVTVIALGPLTTVAAAFERHPRIAERSRVVGMQGSLRLGYQGQPGPVPEYNVASDVDAARRVLAAPWPCTLAPLDTCGSVVLSGARYRRIRRAAERDRLLRTVLKQQEAWLEAVDLPERDDGVTTPLFDTLAVHLAYDESMVDVEAVCVSIDEGGTMRPCGTGRQLRMATTWRDEDAFLDHLVERLGSADPPDGGR